MALASTYAATVEGVVAHVVNVEANVGPGLPGIHMVGLGDTAVRESRDRIRTAVANSTLPWPRTKIMVSLSPAHLPKSGSHFDLPIALAVLACFDPRVERILRETMVLGELGLGGALRRVEGILPMLNVAQCEPTQCETIIIPRANAAEAALVNRGHILVADSLLDVWNWAVGLSQLDQAEGQPQIQHSECADFKDVAGQCDAKFALEVAAAGGHHVLMTGPPGSGKSMLAECLPSILPPMSVEEMIEATSIHSVTGASVGAVVESRPFVAPHPSLSRAALIGGGSGIPRPGAASQAHHGVLFLDEASEIPAATLDALRIPLEKGAVSLSRSRREVIYPADFQLVLAANPCKCGADNASVCRCTPGQRMSHLSNISGPLRDRLDISLTTTSLGSVVSAEGTEPSRAIAQRVIEARERAARRWERAGAGTLVNSRVAATLIRREYPPEESAMEFLGAYLSSGRLTQRGVDRVLKLAWTLADLEATPRPHLGHVAQAAQLRAPSAHEVVA